MKKKNWIIVILLELALLVGAVCMTAFPVINRTYTADELTQICGEVHDDGIYVDQNIHWADNFALTPALKLNYGSYKITVRYNTDGYNNLLMLSYPNVMNSIEPMNGQLYSNSCRLPVDRNEVSMEAYVKSGREDYLACVYFMGEGSLTVESITVRKTAGGVLRAGLTVILLSVIVNLLIVFFDKRKQNKIKQESIQTFFMLSGIIIFTSIPLMFDYILQGHDLIFHLLRIEGIKEGLCSGDFPIKIQSNWLSGNGYATSVFYGDIFLYIPALLRLCGFNITESYNIYIFLNNVATCLISYYCFKIMSGKRNAAVIGSALYTASMYRIIDIYIRSSVGEYSAITFLPLIACGLWKVFTEDTNSEDYSKNWIMPVIGYSGIINTHILTCEMAGAFTILLCLVMIKKIFNKKTFVVLVKIVIYTVILNLGFLLPFLHYMKLGGFIVTNGSRFTSGIQQYGAFLGQLFEPFTTYDGLSVNTEMGIADEMPSTTGLGLVVCAVAIIYVLVSGYVKDKKQKHTGMIALAFAALSLWFSSNLFPWDKLQNMNSLFEKLISMISLPWRFLSIATVMLAVCGIIALINMNEKRKEYKYFMGAMIFACVIQGSVLMSDIMNHYEPYRVYGEQELDTTTVIGAEYLPYGSVVETFMAQYVQPGDNIEYTQNYRHNNYIECSIKNNGSVESNVKFSIVYYEGYTAVDKQTGDKLEVYNDKGQLALKVKPGYSGDVVVRFTGFVLWKISAIVSILALVILIICITGKEKVILKVLANKKN